jgi:hypothetical protein
MAKGISAIKPNWYKIKSIGRPYGFQACAASESNIYVFGGYQNGTKPCNHLYSYNLTQRSWRNLTSVQKNAPPVRARAVGLMTKGRFTTTLGREGPHKNPVWSKALYQLSTRSLNWTERLDTADPPSPRDSYTLTMVSDRHAVLLGGLSPDGIIPMSRVSILNINNRRWRHSNATGDIPPSMGAQNAVSCKFVSSRALLLPFTKRHVLKWAGLAFWCLGASVKTTTQTLSGFSM